MLKILRDHPKTSTECLSEFSKILQNPQHKLLIGDEAVDERFSANIMCNFIKIIVTRADSDYCNGRKIINKKK